MSTAFLSDRVLGIAPSPSIAANALVSELRAQGRDIVNFTVGEPDFDTPAHILEAASAAMHGGDTHYTATSGTLALRQAICLKLKRDNQLDYGLDEVIAGCGWQAHHLSRPGGDPESRRRSHRAHAVLGVVPGHRTAE